MPHPWEVGDHDERAWGYMHPVYNMTLRNKLDPDAETIQTPGQLRAVEDKFVESRWAELVTDGIPGTYDLAGLRSVHRHLFQDVYEWAGDLRTVQVGVGPPGTPDLAWFTRLGPAIEAVSKTIRDTDLLRKIPSSEYPNALADVYSRLNQAHIFRDGNGRSQRAFVAALASESGRRVDWTVVPRPMNVVASGRAIEGDLAPMRDMFALALDNPETHSANQGWDARRIASLSFPHPSARAGKRADPGDDYWVTQRRHLSDPGRDYGRE